jgi:C-terminal binding-module, SLH-like, of glucodextranase
MRISRPTLRAAALTVAAVLGGLAAAPADAGKAIFTLSDPRGDDHGNGTLVYPLDTNFQHGDLDLTSFTARRDGDGTLFEATFARNVRQPIREAIDDLGTLLTDVARFGFYTVNVDVYIDTDRVPGSGGVAMLPGRKAEVDPAFAWDRAVILTPRPNAARGELKRLMSQEIRQAAKKDKDVDRSELDLLRASVAENVEKRVYFPVQIRVRGPKISFFVPGEFFGGPASPDWAYVVVVSGADFRQSLDLGAAVGLGEKTTDRLMILPVGEGTWQDRFGGAPEDDLLEPPLVDIIVPPGTTQERLLSDYDPRDDRPVRLPGVVPGAAQ